MIGTIYTTFRLWQLWQGQQLIGTFHSSRRKWVAALLSTLGLFWSSNLIMLLTLGWSKDGAIALAEWSASDDGKHVAYAVQDGGTDWCTIRALDVNTGKGLDDEIKWARFTPIIWTKDGSGFF